MSNMSHPSRNTEFQAKSLDLALIKAAGSFGVSQSEIAYKVISEKKTGGFLGMFAKPEVTISAWLKRSDRQGQSGQRHKRGGGKSNSQQDSYSHKKQRSSSHSRRGASARNEQRNGEMGNQESKTSADTVETPAIPLTAEQIDVVIAELNQFCKDICERVVGESVSLSHELQNDRLLINIQNAAVGEIMEKNSKFAESLEHLLRKKPRHLKQELPFRIFIDADGVRLKKEAALVQMASDLSQKVFESKKPIVLNYRSPYDRKIIHMALDKDDRVYTKSIGNGSNRKLMILPNRDQGSQDMAVDYASSDIEQINEQP